MKDNTPKSTIKKSNSERLPGNRDDVPFDSSLLTSKKKKKKKLQKKSNKKEQKLQGYRCNLYQLLLLAPAYLKHSRNPDLLAIVAAAVALTWCRTRPIGEGKDLYAVPMAFDVEGDLRRLMELHWSGGLMVMEKVVSCSQVDVLRGKGRKIEQRRTGRLKNRWGPCT